MKTLAERLRYALAHAKMSQSELARRVNIKPQAVQSICSGKTKKSGYTTQFAKVLKVKAHWLATGEGEPFPDGEEPLDSAPAVPAEPEASRPTVDLSATINLLAKELANVTAEEFRQALVRLFEHKAAKALPPPAITYGGPSHRKRRPKPKKGSKDNDEG